MNGGGQEIFCGMGNGLDVQAINPTNGSWWIVQILSTRSVAVRCFARSAPEEREGAVLWKRSEPSTNCRWWDFDFRTKWDFFYSQTTKKKTITCYPPVSP